MTDTSQDEDYIQLLGAVDQLRRNHDRDLERKTRQLLHEVENFRYQRQEDCVRFLQGLMPLMEAARRVDRELDFHVAHRFNALRYLRNDELGISKVIADLLDPSEAHGQGTTYLNALLELLSITPEGTGSRLTNTETVLLSFLKAAENFRVETEQTIKVHGRTRRIDITVEIQAMDKRYCLAFENKPYAGDQQYQCSDYLDFLQQKYHEHFLLVYLPARKRMPSESSLRDPGRWIEHFRVLPYTLVKEPYDEDQQSDGSEAISIAENETTSQGYAEDADAVLSRFLVGDNASLADWFGTCIARTHAERLRWFLREAQLYCQLDIGKSNMTDTEANYVKEHLEKNPEHAISAYAVARAWPAYRDGACANFLSHLAEKLRNKLATKHGELTVKCQYEGKSWTQNLSIYRDSWQRYDGDSNKHHSGLRTSIYLECHESQSSSFWGIRRAKFLSAPNTNTSESNRQKELEDKLSEVGYSNSNNEYLHRAAPKCKYAKWAEIVGEIVRECKSGEGEITKYFVDSLYEFVDKAIPVIDAVEGKREPSS